MPVAHDRNSLETHIRLRRDRNEKIKKKTNKEGMIKRGEKI